MFAFLSEPGPDGIGIAFTDRRGGFSQGDYASFNLGRTDHDDLDALRANMSALRDQLSIGPVNFVHQVHGTTVKTIDADTVGSHDDARRDGSWIDDACHDGSWLDDEWLGDRIPGHPALTPADAQVTTMADTPLAIRVADCVPVLFADPDTGVIGAAHAGRVGLLDGVLQATVRRLKDNGAARLQAWIGPHICGDCYEVPQQMKDESIAIIPELAATTSWGTPALDLGRGAQAVLESLGIVVHRVDPCTRTSADFFSHRGDHGRTGRQIGLIWRESRYGVFR